MKRRLAKSVRQVSADAAMQHHPFFYVPAYDDAMQWLFFVSHARGRPQIFAEHRPDREILQLTRRDDLNEWSLHPSHDGRYVYFTAGSRACRINMETMQEEVLANFGDAPMVAGGMVGDAMGTTTLSRDDRWWAIPVREQAGSRLHILDTQSGIAECILEAPTIFHPEFHPDDASLLRYCGRYDARMWVVNRNGIDNRLVYQRDAGRKEWVVHETWIPGRREILAVDWPHGLFRVAIDSGERAEKDDRRTDLQLRRRRDPHQHRHARPDGAGDRRAPGHRADERLAHVDDAVGLAQHSKGRRAVGPDGLPAVPRRSRQRDVQALAAVSRGSRAFAACTHRASSCVLTDYASSVEMTKTIAPNGAAGAGPVRAMFP